MHALSREDRLRLLKFACSFAWMDLEVQEGERDFVGKLVRRFHLHADERELVEEWLLSPPEVDPQEVPREHRKLFLSTLRELVEKDGVVQPEERESLELLEQLMQ